MENNKVALWQILPTGPTGFGDSPYAARSAFAGNELFISPKKLYIDGLLEIEDILSRAKLIDEDALSTDVIQMGSKVTIKDIEYGDIYKYQIISSTSTSKDKGVDYLTSDESPVAKALIGHKAGDIVDVEAPGGIIKYEAIEITK